MPVLFDTMERWMRDERVGVALTAACVALPYVWSKVKPMLSSKKKEKQAKLRIILVGQQKFCADVFDAYRDLGHDIVAVYTMPDTDARPEPVRVQAEKFGVSVFQPKSFKTAEVANQWKEHNADIAVLAYVTKIIPDSVINTPAMGTICFHPSLLPKYRGGNAIQWQIIQGEKETGVTVFWTDAGADTGPILLQKRAQIKPDDTTASLYFKTLYPIGVDAMKEAITMVANGTAPRLVQDESLSSAQPLCKDKHVHISWDRPGQEVYNLIRGANPQPGAHTTLNGEMVRIFDCSFDSTRITSEHQAGQVVSIASDSFLIACGDSTSIEVKKIKPAGEKRKIPVTDFLSAAKLDTTTVFA